MFCHAMSRSATPCPPLPLAGYRMHTSRFEVCPVRPLGPLARPGRAPPRFVTPAKAGVHPWLPMLPQPVESRANRLRLPRKPRLDPGSGAGATDGGMQYKANGNRCVNPVARLREGAGGRPSLSPAWSRRAAPPLAPRLTSPRKRERNSWRQADPSASCMSSLHRVSFRSRRRRLACGASLFRAYRMCSRARSRRRGSRA